METIEALCKGHGSKSENDHHGPEHRGGTAQNLQAPCGRTQHANTDLRTAGDSEDNGDHTHADPCDHHHWVVGHEPLDHRIDARKNERRPQRAKSRQPAIVPGPR